MSATSSVTMTIAADASQYDRVIKQSTDNTDKMTDAQKKASEQEAKEAAKAAEAVQAAINKKKQALKEYADSIKGLPALDEHVERFTNQIKDADAELSALDAHIKSFNENTTQGEKDRVNQAKTSAKDRKSTANEHLKILTEENKKRGEGNKGLSETKDIARDTGEAFRDLALSIKDGSVNLDALATFTDKLGGTFKAAGFLTAAVTIGLAFKAVYDEGTATLNEFANAAQKVNSINPITGSVNDLEAAVQAAQKQAEVAKDKAGWITWVMTGGKTQAEFRKEAADAVSFWSQAARQAMVREQKLDFSETLLGNIGEVGSAAAKILQASRARTAKNQEIDFKPTYIDSDTPLERLGKQREAEQINRDSLMSEQARADKIIELDKKIANAKDASLKEIYEKQKHDVQLSGELAAQRAQTEIEYQHKIKEAIRDAWNAELSKRIEFNANMSRQGNTGSERLTAANKVKLQQNVLDELNANKDDKGKVTTITDAQKLSAEQAQIRADAEKETADQLDTINRLSIDYAQVAEQITEEKRKQKDLDASGAVMVKDQTARLSELQALQLEDAQLEKDKQRYTAERMTGSAKEASDKQKEVRSQIDALTEEMAVYTKIRDSQDSQASAEQRKTELLKQANKIREDYAKLLTQELMLTKQLTDAQDDRFKSSKEEMKGQHSWAGKLENDYEQVQKNAKNATTREGFNYWKNRGLDLEQKRTKGPQVKSKYELEHDQEEMTSLTKFENQGMLTDSQKARLKSLREGAFNPYKTGDREDPDKALKDKLKLIQITADGVKVNVPQLEVILKTS